VAGPRRWNDQEVPREGLRPPPDLGRFAFLKRVTPRVPDHRLATLSFIEGLGFTRDSLRVVGTPNGRVHVGLRHFPSHRGYRRPLVNRLPVPWDVD
jgi:hypothetical protein